MLASCLAGALACSNGGGDRERRATRSVVGPADNLTQPSSTDTGSTASPPVPSSSLAPSGSTAGTAAPAPSGPAASDATASRCGSEPELSRITAACTSASGCLVTLNDASGAGVATCVHDCFLREGVNESCAQCAAGAAVAAHGVCKLSQCNGNLVGCEACMNEEQPKHQPSCGASESEPTKTYMPRATACGSAEDQQKLDGAVDNYLNACAGGVCMTQTIDEIVAPGSQPLRQCTSDCWLHTAGVTRGCADCMGDVAVQSAPPCQSCSAQIQINPGAAWPACFDCTRAEQKRLLSMCL